MKQQPTLDSRFRLYIAASSIYDADLVLAEFERRAFKESADRKAREQLLYGLDGAFKT